MIGNLYEVRALAPSVAGVLDQVDCLRVSTSRPKPLEHSRNSASVAENVTEAEALQDCRTTASQCVADVDQMAVADPLPPVLMATTTSSPAMHSPANQSAFSRFNPSRRAAPPLPQTDLQPPPFTLESIALLLDRASPTDDLAYLTADYYSTSNAVVRTNGEVTSYPRKSLSFPKVKRDNAIKPCVASDKLLRRAKSVRFADTQGLPLIEAIHQLSAGDSSYTENKIVPYSDNCEFQPVKLVSCRQSVKSKHPTTVPAPKVCTTPGASKAPTHLEPATLSPPAIRPVPQLCRQLSPPTHRRVFRFGQPGSEPGFYERVSREGVVLESIRDEPRMIRGVVRVSNISYHKEVTVRWSHDHWRSYHDTNAVFSANDGHTDRFTFELPANGEDIEFAIRYKCDGSEYWDSNRGKNYVVEGPR